MMLLLENGMRKCMLCCTLGNITIAPKCTQRLAQPLSGFKPKPYKHAFMEAMDSPVGCKEANETQEKKVPRR